MSHVPNRSPRFLWSGATCVLSALVAGTAVARTQPPAVAPAPAPAELANPPLPLALSPTQGLTLPQAMDQAEQHSYAVKTAQASARQADERVGETRGQLGPKFAVEGTDAIVDARANKLVGQILPNGTYVAPRVQSAAATISQPLVGLGPLMLKLKADALNADAASHTASYTKSEARLIGAGAFVRALKAARLYGVAQASYATVAKQKDDARALERAGKLSSVDVMRLDLALSEAQTQLIQARSTVDVAALGLAEALGLPRDRAITLNAGTLARFEEQRRQVPNLEQTMKNAADKRDDLHAATLTVAAAEKLHQAAYFDYVPSVNGFARFERNYAAIDINSPAMPPLIPTPLHYDKADIQDSVVYGLQLNWTIWDWNQRAHKLGEIAASVDKAQLARDALASRLSVEVAQAHAELRYAYQALGQARASVRFAEEVYRGMVLKFKNGLATTTDLIEAERDQTRARGTLWIAQGDLDLAWLKFEQAAGEKVTL